MRGAARLLGVEGGTRGAALPRRAVPRGAVSLAPACEEVRRPVMARVQLAPPKAEAVAGLVVALEVAAQADVANEVGTVGLRAADSAS